MATSDNRPTIHTAALPEDDREQLDENQLAMLIRGGSSLLSILRPYLGPARRSELSGDDEAAIAQADQIATLFACRDMTEVAAIAYFRAPAGTDVLVLTSAGGGGDLSSTAFGGGGKARNSSGGNPSSQSITHLKPPSAPHTWLKTILNELAHTAHRRVEVRSLMLYNPPGDPTPWRSTAPICKPSRTQSAGRPAKHGPAPSLTSENTSISNAPKRSTRG